ncbi:DUF4303 domain-containing protein [Glutamicibacter sp. X7]
MSGAAWKPSPTEQQLIDALVEAVRHALLRLRDETGESPQTVALVTTGDLLRPYLSVTLPGEDPWNFADARFAILGDEHLARLTEQWDLLGDPSELGLADLDGELDRRLRLMEQALRDIDCAGAFGRGEARRQVLLLTETMPPDPATSGSTRRLNPAGDLLQRWIEQACEDPRLSSDLVAAEELSDTPNQLVPAPTNALAQLWGRSPGLYLADGTTIYGPHSLAERNETFEVAEYAPGWVLIGDDSGGIGYLMRAGGAVFEPAHEPAASEVYALDLGALEEDVAGVGDWVTDDLYGWLVRR